MVTATRRVGFWVSNPRKDVRTGVGAGPKVGAVRAFFEVHKVREVCFYSFYKTVIFAPDSFNIGL